MGVSIVYDKKEGRSKRIDTDTGKEVSYKQSREKRLKKARDEGKLTQEQYNKYSDGSDENIEIIGESGTWNIQHDKSSDKYRFIDKENPEKTTAWRTRENWERAEVQEKIESSRIQKMYKEKPEQYRKTQLGKSWEKKQKVKYQVGTFKDGAVATLSTGLSKKYEEQVIPEIQKAQAEFLLSRQQERSIISERFKRAATPDRLNAQEFGIDTIRDGKSNEPFFIATNSNTPLIPSKVINPNIFTFGGSKASESFAALGKGIRAGSINTLGLLGLNVQSNIYTEAGKPISEMKISGSEFKKMSIPHKLLFLEGAVGGQMLGTKPFSEFNPVIQTVTKPDVVMNGKVAFGKAVSKDLRASWIDHGVIKTDYAAVIHKQGYVSGAARSQKIRDIWNIYDDLYQPKYVDIFASKGTSQISHVKDVKISLTEGSSVFFRLGSFTDDVMNINKQIPFQTSNYLSVEATKTGKDSLIVGYTKGADWTGQFASHRQYIEAASGGDDVISLMKQSGKKSSAAFFDDLYSSGKDIISKTKVIPSKATTLTVTDSKILTSALQGVAEKTFSVSSSKNVVLDVAAHSIFSSFAGASSVYQDQTPSSNFGDFTGNNKFKNYLPDNIFATGTGTGQILKPASDINQINKNINKNIFKGGQIPEISIIPAHIPQISHGLGSASNIGISTGVGLGLGQGLGLEQGQLPAFPNPAKILTKLDKPNFPAMPQIPPFEIPPWKPPKIKITTGSSDLDDEFDIEGTDYGYKRINIGKILYGGSLSLPKMERIKLPKLNTKL